MTTGNKNPLILVDGSSYLFRAFHAMPPLMNSKGQPTGAIYGVVNMLKKLQKDYHTQQIAVVFDAKGKTFRNDMYPDYKANRPAMPDDLRVQIEPLHRLIKNLGFPFIMVEGVEADDVIGTLAHKATSMQQDVIISTGDKDMAQLVNNHVNLVNTMTNTHMDAAGVLEKFGVNPEQIIDYLTLIGDKVDNVPGVEKCGPKTAVKWLQQYHDLDTIIAHADEIKGKVGENLRAALPQLPLSKQLITIKLDVDLPIALSDLQMKSVDNQKVTEDYKTLEFKTWLSEALSDDATEDSQATESNYQIIIDQKDFDLLINKLKKSKLFAFDTETTSLNYMQAELVGLSFAVTPGEAMYIPVAHDYLDAPKQLDKNQVLNQLKPLLEDPKQAKVGQHLKYDKNVLANYGISLHGIAYDTMLESYVLNSTASRHDMDSLALKYLGKTTIHFEDIAGKGAKQLTFNQIPLEEAGPYAAEDADITLQLHHALWPALEQHAGLVKTLKDIEIPLVEVLSAMERSGVLIDEQLLNAQTESITKRLNSLEKNAFDVAGEEFNLNSPKQLQVIFYEKMALPVLQKTPKGQPSTAEPVLQELALDYELPKLILEYRSLNKLKTTYTERLPEQINPETHRVHTSYHQAVAATGRLSSTEPNLQNIPIRTEEGRKIRKAFIAPKGFKLIAADYSQIELRIMAHLSGDDGLLTAFAQGQDIHSATASEVFGVDINDVTAEQRRRAKATNFGLIYGMSAFGLAKQLGITRKEAQTYIDLYFDRYPGVHTYMERTRELAHQQGYVETLYGRRLYLPEINSRNKQRQMAAERTAINAPMQGTAADIIKKAMLNLHQWVLDIDHDAKMIMQVHDELVFEIIEADVANCLPEIKQRMETAAKLDVPLIVDIGVGDNWDEAH